MIWKVQWTDSLDKSLIELREKNWSGAQIAAAINGRHGTSFSRNAIIGRLDRLGLKLGKSITRRFVGSRVKPIETKERLTVGVGAQVQAIRRKQKAVVPAPVEDAFTPRTVNLPSHRKTILDLRAMECRWPDEDRDSETGWHTFCGCRTADGSSYCPAHSELSKGQGTASERNAPGLLRRAAA